eukprot:scaffold3857_cov140-Skeletonema_menzelii.AAC.8
MAADHYDSYTVTSRIDPAFRSGCTSRVELPPLSAQVVQAASCNDRSCGASASYILINIY